MTATYLSGPTIVSQRIDAVAHRELKSSRNSSSEYELGIVVLAHRGGSQRKEKIPLDTTQLEHPTEFVVLPDLALPDAGYIPSVKREYFARFDGVSTRERLLNAAIFV